MKKVLFLVLFFLWTNNSFAGYSYYRSIVVQSSKISGGADLTQFPILVCGNSSAGACTATLSGLNQSGGGAHVQNANGYDIIFTTDAACSNLLTWEMENYVASTGEFEAWVTNTSTPLSHSSNTTFYMCYGNSGISTFQGGSTGAVWDSNYYEVYHFPNGSTLSGADSTSVGNNLTNYSATATSGQVDGGVDGFSSGGYLTTSTSTYSGATTVNQWVNCTQNNFYQIDWSAGGTQLEMWINEPGNYALWILNGAYYAITTITVCDGTWHMLTGVYHGSYGSSTDLQLYVDGSLNASAEAYAASASRSGSTIGNRAGSTLYPVEGSLDEIEVSDIDRSAGYITTEFNNQSAPSSFYTMGSETTPNITTGFFVLIR